MRIIPVLDILESKVVRGVAGRRDLYRPLQSTLVKGNDPVYVAKAIYGEFGLGALYVADLDAILHRRLNREIFRTLVADRLSLIVDAGIRRCEDADELNYLGVQTIVAGLETLEAPRELAYLVAKHGPSRVVFSLDLREGQPLSASSEWPDEPLEIVRSAHDTGCRELIVLDVAKVGTGGGVPTLALCDRIRCAFPKMTIFTGGGIRGVDDLKTLEKAGIDGVLIASALHDRSITNLDLARLRERVM
jgi:phosphoribosylformimino-5-aminoimidazole carboxamide ribotide isomerase